MKKPGLSGFFIALQSVILAIIDLVQSQTLDSLLASEFEILCSITWVRTAMEIAKLMTHPVDVVKLDDSLAHVKNLFELRSFHHLAVVDQGQLVGLVSDRDLLKALSPNLGSPSETTKDLMCLNKRVHQIMTRNLITIKLDQGMFHAIRLFNRHNISCLPVIDDKLKPIGMLSWRDIMRFIEKNQMDRMKNQP